MRHTQRGKLHVKLAQPFKDPYICIKILHNNNVALTPLAGGKVIHTHLNNCKVVPLIPDHLVLNPLPTISPTHSNSSANAFCYSKYAAQLFECTEEDNAPAPPQPNASPPRSPSPAPAANPPLPLLLKLLLISHLPILLPLLLPAALAKKNKAGPACGKKAAYSNQKKPNPLHVALKNSRELNYLINTIDYLLKAGSELVVKVSSTLSPKKGTGALTRSQAPKEGKNLHADAEMQDSETEEWTDTESLADS